MIESVVSEDEPRRHAPFTPLLVAIWRRQLGDVGGRADTTGHPALLKYD